MDDAIRHDIRTLLKTFGIKADQAVTAYLAGQPDDLPLYVRIHLSATTEHESGQSDPAFEVTVEGEIRG